MPPLLWPAHQPPRLWSDHQPTTALAYSPVTHFSGMLSSAHSALVCSLIPHYSGHLISPTLFWPTHQPVPALACSCTSHPLFWPAHQPVTALACSPATYCSCLLASSLLLTTLLFPHCSDLFTSPHCWYLLATAPACSLAPYYSCLFTCPPQLQPAHQPRLLQYAGSDSVTASFRDACHNTPG